MSDSLPEIEPRALAPEGSLAGDLLAGRPPAVALFPHEARRPPAGAPPPARLPAGALRPVGPEAAAKAERILSGEGWLVTTGQQPLLFLGPLYVLYKLQTAVALAERMEAELGVPVLASFWVASDDHDWDEVGLARLIDTRNELRELRLTPPAGREGRPAGPTPLPTAITGLIDDLSETLPDTSFSAIYLEKIRDAYRPSRTLTDAFSDLLASTLPDAPFVLVDAADPTLKRASVPLVRAAIREAGAAESRLGAATDEVERAGYEARIALLPGGSSVFLDPGSGRERLYRDGEGRWRIGREGKPIREDELLARLEDRPEDFSPNVALRPVLESWLLPVAATVLGPGELEYWTQLPGQFEVHGVPMPALHPRTSWTLIEAKVRKVLEKLGAEPEELADGGDALARREVERGRPDAVEAALRAACEREAAAYDRLAAAIATEMPGLRSAVGKARSAAGDALDALEGTVDARLRDRQQVLHRQIRKAARHLFPEGSPQERVIAPSYFLARYGPELVRELGERTAARVPAASPLDVAGAGGRE